MNQPAQGQPASGATAQALDVDAPRLETGERAITLLGWIATATAVVMYVSYVSQIQLNLAGRKGSAVQPLATMVNCSLWVAYGLLERVRDWPVALASAPGVILGAITFATAL